MSYRVEHKACIFYVVVVVQSLSHVWLFVTPWTVTCQAPKAVGFFWARILEWVAISFSGGSSQPRDQTQVSCIAGRFFTTEPPGKPGFSIYSYDLQCSSAVGWISVLFEITVGSGKPERLLLQDGWWEWWACALKMTSSRRHCTVLGKSLAWNKATMIWEDTSQKHCWQYPSDGNHPDVHTGERTQKRWYINRKGRLLSPKEEPNCAMAATWVNLQVITLVTLVRQRKTNRRYGSYGESKKIIQIQTYTAGTDPQALKINFKVTNSGGEG